MLPSTPPMQLSVSFIPEEDRLLLRLGFDSQQAAFWLTRRFVRLAWPVLTQGVRYGPPAGGTAPPPVLNDAVREELHAFQREAVLQQADFATEYDAQRTPVWDTPVLATEFSLQTNAQGAPVMAIRNGAGVGVELVLDVGMHAGLARLIEQAVAQSGWDLELQQSGAARSDGSRPPVVH